MGGGGLGIIWHENRCNVTTRSVLEKVGRNRKGREGLEGRGKEDWMRRMREKRGELTVRLKGYERRLREGMKREIGGQRQEVRKKG